MRGWRLFAVPHPGEAGRLAPKKAEQLAGIMRGNLDLLERAYVPSTESHDRRDHTVAELEAELNAVLVEFSEMKIIVDCLLDRIAELEALSELNKE